MPRHQREYTEEEKHAIEQVYNQSKNVREQKRLLCIKLRAEKGMPTKLISEIVGYKPITVDTIISKYGKFGLEALMWHKQKGNRRNLSFEDETALLEPFLKEAESGKMLIVSDIHKAYEKAFNLLVPTSTIYRMLSRHGWRKIMPRSKHPKFKPEEVGAYKKNL